MSKTLGERIKAARTEAGLSQRQFGEMCNISKDAICAIENGKTKKPCDALASIIDNAIAHLLNNKREHFVDTATTIRRLKNKLKISYDELGRQCNLHRDTVWQTANNPNAKPTFKTISAIASVLGVTVETIAGDYFKHHKDAQ